MDIDWFIPKVSQGESKTRATIFVHIVLSSIFILCTLHVANLILESNSNFPFINLTLGLICLTIFYKITGSIAITGNIISLVIFCVLFKLGLTTGGIFSEDIHSLYLTPLLAFSIIGLRSGLFWFAISVIATIYTFFIAGSIDEVEYFRNQTRHFEPNYYVMLCLVNLIIISTTLTVFHLQYKKLIKKIKENQRALIKKTKLLELTQEKLMKSNKALDQYAHTTAHDLKQPIRTIYSFTQLLGKELKKENPREIKKDEYLSIIQESSASMNQMVDDLLEYSKLVNIDNTNFTKVNLTRVIETAQSNLKNLIDSSKTTIYCQSLPTLNANQTQITQLFQNLLYNAIKFGALGRTPEIHIECKEKEEEFIFTVSDNGIGIEKKELENIFQPFNKLHSAKDYEGSGIGLATCKKIAELHGGKIWATSTFGEGANFYFTINKTLE